MKKIFLLPSFLLLSVWSAAQTQQGYVKTKGRLGNNGTVIAGTRLQGATVTVKGSNAVVSGNNGTFSLAIPTSNYYLQNVQKQGYVLTDPDVLSKQYALSKNPLVLVLEIPSQQTDDKLAAERKIRRTLQRQLQEKEDEIETLKEQQKISEEEYRKQLQEIYAQQESNEKLISEMADRYSKMDFDEVDEFNRRVSDLILNGKLIEANSLLNTKGDINCRAATLRLHQEANVQAEQEIKKKQKKLEKSKAMTQKELEDLAHDCYRKFEIFEMQHLNDSAIFYIKLRSDLDSTNLHWLDDYGNYIQTYLADYSKASSCYEKILQTSLSQNGENNEWTAMAYCHLADIMIIQGKYSESIEHYFKALKIYQNILGNDSREVSVVYNSIGYANKFLGKYSEALNYYKKSLEIKKTLFTEESEEIATSYHHIGNVYEAMKDHSSALYYCSQALAIAKKVLLENNPSIITFYNDLGVIYGSLHDFDKARYYYEKALKIGEEVLFAKHPYLSTLLNNLGTICDNQNDYSKALDYYNKGSSPNRVGFIG